MRTHEPQAWANQRVELLHEGSIGPEFLAFVETLTAEAEKLIDQGTAVAEAFRTALAYAEGVHGQELSPALITQIFVVLFAFWEYRNELWTGLTAIEQRVALEALAVKIAELNQEAAMREAAANPALDND